MVRAYDAEEIGEYGVRELGYLAVEEGDLVQLSSTVGEKGHPRNCYGCYFYAQSVCSGDWGWLPVDVIDFSGDANGRLFRF